jgi:hypothetical protein
MIDRCVCFNRSFRRIHKESSENGIDTLDDLKRIMNICNKCCLCNPYIERMYETGELSFTTQIPQASSRVTGV